MRKNKVLPFQKFQVTSLLIRLFKFYVKYCKRLSKCLHKSWHKTGRNPNYSNIVGMASEKYNRTTKGVKFVFEGSQAPLISSGRGIGSLGHGPSFHFLM